MDAQDAVDLGREALRICLIAGAPMLVAALAVGLLAGLLQALTQIQEQALGFVPKLVAVAAVLALCLPWLLDRLLQYSSDLIVSIPGRL